jgi:hypothetical protein
MRKADDALCAAISEMLALATGESEDRMIRINLETTNRGNGRFTRCLLIGLDLTACSAAIQQLTTEYLAAVERQGELEDEA